MQFRVSLLIPAGININNPLGQWRIVVCGAIATLEIRRNDRVSISPFRVIKPRSGVHYAHFCRPFAVRVTQFFPRIIDIPGAPRAAAREIDTGCRMTSVLTCEKRDGQSCLFRRVLRDVKRTVCVPATLISLFLCNIQTICPVNR